MIPWKDWGKRLYFFDGAMGTMLQQAGLGPGEKPELWNLTHPQVVQSIHGAYLDAGVDLLKSNTFGANRLKLQEQTVPVIEAGVRLARQALAQAGREGYVAMDIGPTGKLLQPLGDLSFAGAYDLFAEMARAGEMAGADFVLLETMSDLYELKAAVLAVKENTRLPIVATLIFDGKGKLLTGGDISAAVALLEGLGVDALGLNCGLGPVQMLPLAREMGKISSLPLVLNPNAGLPRSQGDATVFDVGPQEFARTMVELAREGAWAVGGCCGTTPEHLGRAIKLCREIIPRPVADKGRTVVSSYGRAVVLGKDPVLVGERINPTGKPKLKQALREGNMEYLLQEAVAQQQCGAHILDVNVGLPEIHEAAVMGRAVQEIQSVTDLPLQIDTADPVAMERGMRVYNGKPLINSVNGKRESMEQVFPLMKKYGAVAVVLTLDEKGIPDTSQGRFEIAQRVVQEAARWGIPKKELVVDCLAMTISSKQDSAQVALQAMKLVKEHLGVCTTFGVSNISFGLPQRGQINAAFLLLALQAGLDAAIVNPGAQNMRQAYDAYRALACLDENCMDYITRYGNQEKPQRPAQKDRGMDLAQAVLHGLKEQAVQAAKLALQEEEPLEIVQKQLVPALDQVGQDFERGTLFLPQLLMSAEAAKGAFGVVQERLAQKGGDQPGRGKVLVATVQGDIHDIGKNIAKVLLENYGYQVVDLGKDVPPEQIVQRVTTEKIPLVGLSALMTTTVPSMARTIALLRERAPWCKGMVGGAVLTQDYAAQIGAGAYVEDAMAAVGYAGQVLS